MEAVGHFKLGIDLSSKQWAVSVVSVESSRVREHHSKSFAFFLFKHALFERFKIYRKSADSTYMHIPYAFAC